MPRLGPLHASEIRPIRELAAELLGQPHSIAVADPAHIRDQVQRAGMKLQARAGAETWKHGEDGRMRPRDRCRDSRRRRLWNWCIRTTVVLRLPALVPAASWVARGNCTISNDGAVINAERFRYLPRTITLIG
jgi:hypothetical protein